MPYTLAKFFLWGLLMAFTGGVVGWLLRSLKARTDLARLRSRRDDEPEVERLRGRLANLEPVVAERDRLRMELADVRGSSAGALGFSSTIDTSIVLPGEVEPLIADATPPADPKPDPDPDSGPQPDPDPDSGPQPDPDPDSGPQPDPDPDSGPQPDPDPDSGPQPDPDPDLAAAAAVLGKKLAADDLTAIEGIGPKIAELCGGLGITTWSQLATTEVDALQSMLDAAGSRFQMHKPASWPQQAALLAAGRWDEFKELTETLAGGK